jgi:hypothetical protein
MNDGWEQLENIQYRKDPGNTDSYALYSCKTDRMYYNFELGLTEK